MIAAVLKQFGSPLAIEDVPSPVLGTGEVIVDVVSTQVLPYAAQVLSAARAYMMELPIVPGGGAIGRVRAVGPDATKLKVGDWVNCDATVRARDDALTPDITLQGISARGPGGLQLARHFHDGAWAEQMRVPTENAVPIGDIDEADADKWTTMGLLLVPYGGLLSVNMHPGETIVISGATGNFGSAAVVVALALGARRVVAPGRNEAVLDDLRRRFGERVAPVVLSGDETNDGDAIRAAAEGPIDVAFDIMPPMVDARVTRTVAMTVREFGRVSLMGGVGMLGGDDLALPYPWLMRNGITVRGQWMYPATANRSMANLIRSGLIDLDQWTIERFSLNQIKEAVDHAAREGGAFKATVVRP